MCVRAQEADDLLARDAHAHSATDGFTSNFARNHVWVPSADAGEEVEDGDLQLRGGVGVDAIVSLDDDESLITICGAEGVVETCGDAAEGTGVGCEGRGEARRVEARGLGAGLVDYSEVAKVF